MSRSAERNFGYYQATTEEDAQKRCVGGGSYSNYQDTFIWGKLHAYGRTEKLGEPLASFPPHILSGLFGS